MYDVIHDICRSHDKSGKENDADGSSKQRSHSKERPGEERKRSGGEGGAARTKPRESRKVRNLLLNVVA